jgi:hypothetical protein
LGGRALGQLVECLGGDDDYEVITILEARTAVWYEDAFGALDLDDECTAR